MIPSLSELLEMATRPPSAQYVAWSRKRDLLSSLVTVLACIALGLTLWNAIQMPVPLVVGALSFVGALIAMLVVGLIAFSGTQWLYARAFPAPRR